MARPTLHRQNPFNESFDGKVWEVPIYSQEAGRMFYDKRVTHKEATIKIPGNSLWGMISSEISLAAIKMHLYFILLQDPDGGVAYDEPRFIEILGVSKNSYDIAIRELRKIGVIASRHPETHEEKEKNSHFFWLNQNYGFGRLPKKVKEAVINKS